MKALLISIRPEHALNILNGNKTLELCKSVPKGYVGWVYVYVTKGKPYLLWEEDYIGGHYVSHRWTFLHGYSKERAYEIWGSAYENEETYVGIVNGLVIMRFWFDEYIKLEWLDPSLNIKRNDVNYYNYYALFENIYNNVEWILPNLCLTKQQVIDYGKERDLYAWHIKKLEIFDKPMELGEFYNHSDSYEQCPFAMSLAEEYMTQKEILVNRGSKKLTKAPQSWQYVWVKGEIK